MIAEYKGKPGALIPVLQLAQGIFGYLPEVALKHIARELRKPYSEVAGVVGFYSFFTTVPRGKHLVRICLGTACYVRGGVAVSTRSRSSSASTSAAPPRTASSRSRSARCFGACGLAPVITVDDDVHHRVKPKRGQRDPRPVRRRSPSLRRRKERLTMADKITSPARLLAHGRRRPRPTSTCAQGRKETQVTVHMGTCGIAAGARDVVAAFMTEIAAAGVDNVGQSHQSGCAGLCEEEPMATVHAGRRHRVPLRPARQGQGAHDRRQPPRRRHPRRGYLIKT